MSFICTKCHTPHHGVPTVRVLERRQKQYINYFKERTLTSHGHEIVKEAKFCPTCGDETPEAETPLCAPPSEERFQEEDTHDRPRHDRY